MSKYVFRKYIRVNLIAHVLLTKLHKLSVTVMQHKPNHMDQKGEYHYQQIGNAHLVVQSELNISSLRNLLFSGPYPRDETGFSFIEI
jgi:hypothetical protein